MLKVMSRLILVLLVQCLTAFSVINAVRAGVSPNPPLQTVPFVDVQKYLGTWFQISRVVLPFEGDCACAQQTLGFDASRAEVTVYNSCNDKTPYGKLREIRGTATNDDPQSNAKFTVDFGLPKKGQYWIVALGANYEYAVVSDPNRKSLYILSKTPELDPVLYQEALAKASLQLDTSRLVFTEQKGCSYPSEVIVPAHRSLSTPEAPIDPMHPGSKDYSHTASRHTVKCLGRDTPVFLSSKKTPQVLVAFGHGQALDTSHYEGTHEHLAKKGIASLNPPYDTGFFDRDWGRMGADYAKIVDCVADAFPGQIDRTKVVYAGHSKGAYVGQIAAGIAHQQKMSSAPKAILLFNPAGHDLKTLKQIGQATATSIVFSDQDKVVKRSDSEAIFQNSGSSKRQLITLKSYSSSPPLTADHFWSLTRPSAFGGGTESAFHYYGSWKWLAAAAADLEGGTAFTSEYLYGRETTDKGLGGAILDDRIANF